MNRPHFSSIDNSENHFDNEIESTGDTERESGWVGEKKSGDVLIRIVLITTNHHTS